MANPSQRPPRRRKKKEPLVILLIALVVALVAWPFEKLFGRQRGSRRRVVALLVGVLAALVVAVVAFSQATQADTIHANVTVHGVGVGGLTIAQATAKLERADLSDGALTVTWGTRDWTLSGAALRARLQAKVAARAAYRYAREGNLLTRSWDRVMLLFTSHSVAPVVHFSEPLTRERLDAIARAVDVKPVDGAVTVRGSQPEVRRAADGREVERAALLRLLGDAVLSGGHEHAALPVVTVAPAISTADAQAAAKTAASWLAGPLSLTHGGRTWTISRQELGQYLAFVHAQSSPHLRVTFDSPVTRGYFDYLTEKAGKPGKDASFVVSDNGRHVHVRRGTPSYGVVPARTIANMEAAAASGDRTAQAVFGKAPAELSYADARAMDITTRIGTYTTGVAGTTNRLDNVSLGSSLLDDSLIAPGKVFSVNATTGERTAAKGFKMAPTIINGQLEDSVGGGMCQVSTTVFNAAFEAGLQIVERHNHELYISHYPLGRDATVSYGSYDLKFRNDTSHWILLKTDFTGWSLTVSLYSAPLHRRVVSSTGDWYGMVPFSVHKQHDPTMTRGTTKVDTPGIDGMSIDCYRKVYGPDGALIWNDDFKSVYSMVPEVLLVGTKKAATPSPGASASPGSGSPNPKASPTAH